jgi:hypothetical protein
MYLSMSASPKFSISSAILSKNSAFCFPDCFLQGFPDGYTDIQPNGKPTPDGPRYKALGKIGRAHV